MVNFRFHLVSLTAVFLALAAGIAIGAGVVDRQTVDFLESRLETVENNRRETNAANDELRGQLTEWKRFTDEAGDRMVEGRLTALPVLLVTTDGTDSGVVNSLRTSLDAAGAALQGTLTLTPKWALTDAGDVTRLAEVLHTSTTTKPAELRATAMSRLVSTWAAGNIVDVVVPLRDAGFLGYDAPPGQTLTIEQVPFASVDVALVSASGASVPNHDLVPPFVSALVDASVGVLAAEPVAPTVEEGDDPAPPGAASVVRDDDRLAGQVATVDNVDDYRGRIAAVMAIAELQQGRTGHYGVGSGAQRLLPEAPA